MKKVVVVYGEYRDVFEGEELELINKGALGTVPNSLVVKDGDKVIAVYNNWDYWKKIE